ncbi:MAG TPA: Ku protein [Blastocatellia bacterium]|nr:Ku protein [Blastocatellia bacterium]
MPRKAQKKQPAGEERSTPRPFWSGTITFGLVSVPVNMFPASRSSRASLRMLGPEGQPLRRRYYSPETERDLGDDEMARGYEYEKGEYVIVTDEELERLEPKKSRDIDLRTFVPEDSIPPVYSERGYFLTPDGNTEKAYRLLAETMEETGQAGIATFVMRGKEYVVAIFSDHGVLRAETMRFADELRTPDDLELPEKPKVPAATVRKFEKLISSRTKKELPLSKRKDDRTERLLKLVKKRQANRKNVIEIEEETGGEDNVVDILDVLKRSLAKKKS